MKTAPTLHTDRLKLRPFSQDDLQDIIHYLVSDPTVMATLPEVRVDDPQEQRSVAQEYIDDASTPWGAGRLGAWAVCPRSLDGGDTAIGFCGFFKSKLESPDPEIGYAIGRQWWGSGIVSEAARTAVAWAFANSDINGIYGVTFAENQPSQAVLRKLGFTHTDDIDLYNSVRDGRGLMRYFYLTKHTCSRV